MMIYAQIKNGVVQNTIVVDDSTPMELFSQGYDYFIRIDEMDPQPSIGWTYDGETFVNPPYVDDII